MTGRPPPAGVGSGKEHAVWRLRLLSRSTGHARVAMWVLAVIVPLVTCSGHATSPDMATDVIRFAPRPPPTATPQDGSCFGHALTVNGRDDAWRCTTEQPAADGRNLFDPCFATDPGDVVCNANPAIDDAGVLLRLTAPLPDAAATPPPQPRVYWLVVLADGTECRFDTGATGGVDGAHANYRCADGSWLFGDVVDAAGDGVLQAHRGTAAELVSPDLTLEEMPTVAIAKAWR